MQVHWLDASVTCRPVADSLVEAENKNVETSIIEITINVNVLIFIDIG